MKLISDTLGVSRSHLRQSFCKTVGEPRKPRGKAPAVPDAGVLQLLHELVEARPSYGYRRACAVVNRKLSVQGKPRVNHKRIYRLMSDHKLLLPKFVGFQPKRKHEGQVRTLRSNTRWCSDSFQIRCWDGRKVEVVFVLDTCDREVLSLIGVIGNLQASDVKDALALAYESRFHGHKKPVTPIEWLTDNGGIFVANETQDFAVGLGFIPYQMPAYSPESNGMSEAFV
jgi:putative transposase